ncbi:MAG: peptidylprolyl isomerase [Isosphaeraceae bacterium]
MWNRNRGRRLQMAVRYRGASTRPVRRVSCEPALDVLENRQLMTASLQAIPAVTVPALQGYTVPLLANSGTTDAQTFTVTSSNPDIAASVAQGPFWTLGVSYDDSTNASQSFTGSLTFQLFQTLTPNTVNMITQFTNDEFYVNSGYYFPRVVSDFDSPTTTVIQGGSTTQDGTGTGGEPNTPFANENVQQLALTGVDQLALANAGGTDTNNTQFFINTGPADALGYNYTVFGQLVSGQATLAKMASIPVQLNPVSQENSEPVNPLKITSASLSSTSPDGVVILDTTQAKPGEMATITVKATDPVDGTTTSQSFDVLVGPYIGPTTSSTIGNVNFKPYASPVAAAAYDNVANQIQLSGQSTYPDTTVPAPLSYDLISQPSHGTISNFNAATGTLTYTPDPGYLGADTFQYVVTATGPNTSAAPATSNPATVTLAVSAPPPVVSVQNVSLATNQRHMVSQIDVTFSGQVNATEADETGIYHLAFPNKKGSYTARNAVVVKLRSAVYSAATDSVTLTPRRPFALKSQALQLEINGTSPSGLQDAVGQYIAGAANGPAGSDAVVLISKNVVEVE